MVLSYEARVALLEKARAAKAAKRAGLNQVKEEDVESAPSPAPKPKKSRAKSVKPPTRTLELPKTPEPLSDEEPEVEERIVYRPKPSKKKKIIRTIIKDPSDDDEDEEEIHETVEQPPKPKKQIPATQPKLCPSKSSFFCY